MWAKVQGVRFVLYNQFVMFLDLYIRVDVLQSWLMFPYWDVVRLAPRPSICLVFSCALILKKCFKKKQKNRKKFSSDIARYKKETFEHIKHIYLNLKWRLTPI